MAYYKIKNKYNNDNLELYTLNGIQTKCKIVDVYDGDKLEEGKVSYAIGLILQDESKTLTDKQIDKSVARILDGITKATGATLR